MNAVRKALRRLTSDDWVIGLAAAVAIGYASVLLVRSLVDLVIGVVQDRDEGRYFSFTVAGRTVAYEQPLVWAATLGALTLLAAWLLRRSRGLDGRS